MLVAERDGQGIGAGFAFRHCSQPREAVTLGDVGVLAPRDGIGLQRRLIRTLEQAARRLGAERVILGGPTGTERELYLSMGYRGRHEGGLMTRALPPPRGRAARQPRPAHPLLP